MQTELITDDYRKTKRVYKSRPFRVTAAQRRLKSLTDEQLAWALKVNPKWALLNVV